MAEQVGKFLTELPELETPTDGDLMYIVDDETTSKKITMSNLKRVLGGNVTGTVEGASVSLSDGADGIPMEECEVTLVPSQDLHGYSKPWAGGAGKNKFDGEYPEIGNIIKYRPIPITNGTYTMSTNLPLNGEAANIFFLAGSVSEGASTQTNGVSEGIPRTVTVTNGYITVAYRILNGEQAYNPENFNSQIESGSTATTYEPYSNICPISGHTDVTVTVASTSGGSGEDTTVALGRTVYKGWVNLSTGEGAITGADVNLSQQNLSYNKFTTGTSDRFYVRLSNYISNVMIDGFNDIESDYFDAKMQSTNEVGTTYMENGYLNMNMTIGQFADTTAFKTWIESESVHLVYELATPQNFTLTPTQIKTLLGQNYVRHDGGGNIKVVYIRDLDIVINDLIDRVTALENE